MSHGPITNALQGHPPDPRTFHWLPWRIGRKVGRTIYAQVGAEPSDSDVLIGVMDTALLAEEAASTHNAALTDVQRLRLDE